MLSTIFAIIYGILSVFEILLFVRAICSWVEYFRESKVYAFAFKLTEPILRPVRDLMFKIEFVRRCPLDLSFLVVVIIVNMAMNLCYYFI